MLWNQAVRQLKTFSQSATIRHSGISFVGTAINGFLGIVYFFYLSSKLSPDGFGHFSIAVGLITVGFSIFNFGLDQSIIKYKSDTQILANIFFIKIFVCLVISVIPVLMFGLNNLFGLIGLGIAAQLLFSLSTSFLQSWQKYYSWVGLFILTNLLRLGFAVFTNSPTHQLIIYFLMPFLGFLIFYFLNYMRLPKPKYNYLIIKKFIRFNTHLSGNSIFSSITAKLDAFFIASFQNFAAAGLYSLSSQLSSSISQLASAYSAVISPKYSSFDNPNKNRLYLVKNLIFSLAIAILLIPSLLIAGYILFSISHKDFSSSYFILLLLLVGYAIFFASVPLRESLLYYYSDSKIFFLLSVLGFLFSVFTGFVFIRPFGPIAAAAAFLAFQIISTVILTLRYVTQDRRPYHS